MQISSPYEWALGATLAQHQPASMPNFKPNLGFPQNCDNVHEKFGSVELSQLYGPGEVTCHKRKFLLAAYQDAANCFNQEPAHKQSLQALELSRGVV